MDVGADSPVTVVLAQDDPADAIYARDSLELNKIINPLVVVRHVREAISCLRRDPPYEAGPAPDVVLLDLNLPREDGRHLLRHIRATPPYSTMPVFLLVDSVEMERMVRAEELPVQGYLRKPVDFEALCTVVRSVSSFGFAVLRTR